MKFFNFSIFSRNCPRAIRRAATVGEIPLSPNENLVKPLSRTVRDRENLSSSFALRRFSGQSFNQRRGVATLPVILLIGGLITEISIAGAFIAYFLSQSGFGIKLSEEALAAAQAGAQDAMIRIVRNKNFNPSPNPYTITIGNVSAQITVCKDTCAGINKFQVDSLGISFNKRRQIRAIIHVDNLTGKVELESEKEVATQ